MKTTAPTSEYVDWYRNLFRSHVFQLLAWGYYDAQSSKELQDYDETSITGYIVSAIKDRQRALDRPSWCKNYAVYDDPPQDRPGVSGKRRPRVDIVVEATYGHRPEFMFEAKRLQTSRFGTRKYIGKDGLGCFVSGLYAARYDEAGMIGYVQSNSTDYWRRKLWKAIEKSACELSLCSSTSFRSIITSLPQTWISEHGRDSVGRDVTIYFTTGHFSS